MIKIIVGLLIIGTALWGYHYDPSHMYELTFISNFSCGLVLLLDGAMSLINRRSLPVFLYQLVLPCTNSVFLTTVFTTLLGWHDFNFSGMFFFMHAINPVIFFFIYLFSTKLEIRNNKDYVRRVFIAPAMMMAYAIFDLIRFMITGELVYGLIATDKLNCISVPFIGIGLYLLMAFMSYGLIDLKLYVQKRMDC